MSMAEATFAETEINLKELQKFRNALAANLERWRRQSGRGKAAAEFCALIEASGGEASRDVESRPMSCSVGSAQPINHRSQRSF